MTYLSSSIQFWDKDAIIPLILYVLSIFDIGSSETCMFDLILVVLSYKLQLDMKAHVLWNVMDEVLYNLYKWHDLLEFFILYKCIAIVHFIVHAVKWI